MNKGYCVIVTLLLSAMTLQAQTSWKKVKKESLPSDFKKHKLLIEQFEYVDPESLDEESSLDNYAVDKKGGQKQEATTGIDADVNYDYEKRDMIKLKIEETNDHLADYNNYIKAAMDSSKIKHFVVGSTVAEGTDTASFSKEEYPYVLRHKYVYYASTTNYQGFHIPAGYNIAFYVHDRKTGKDYPYIKMHYGDLSYTLERIAEKMAKDK
ncbi:MAG: hypothetical protein KDD36_13870 [Flavobacteriales bacterium]|nr:hypothetical protein [Flavobacteriales bacterium]